LRSKTLQSPTPQPRPEDIRFFGSAIGAPNWQAPTAGRSYELPPLAFNAIPTGDAYHRDDAEGLREFDRLMGGRS
jgi:hypothetical protein